MSAFVKKYPAISLLILALIFGSAPVLAVAAGLLPPAASQLGALSSSLAAIVLVVIEGRKGGLRELLGRFLIWRVGLQWWAFTLFFAIVPTVAALYLFNLLGGPPVDWSGLQPLYTVVPMFLFLTIAAGIGEEFGWRGFLLPRLQTRHNALVSSLIVGVVWAIWHIPLFFIKGTSQYNMQTQDGLLPVILGYSLFVIVSSIQFAWVFNNTRGSVLLAAVFHGAMNTWGGYIDVYRGHFGGILTFGAVSVVASIIIVLIAGATNLSRTNKRNMLALEAGQPDSAQSQKGDIQMNKRKWFWIMGVCILLIAGILVGGLGILGRLPWQSGNLYEDPQGRFTMKIESSWEQVETDGSYAAYRVASPSMHLYLLVLKASKIDDAFSLAVQILGLNPDILNGGTRTSFGDWQAYGNADAAQFATGFAGQLVGDNAYVLVVKGDKPGVPPENPAVVRLLSSIKIAGKKEIVVQSYADAEALLRQQVDSLAGSASVALVHQNKIVYTYAYGKANPLSGVVADTQTLYHYGSMTKPVTATALMQLVEQGKVDLDAWPGKYIPEFPKSWKVTVRQLLDHSACMPDNGGMTVGLIARRGEKLPSFTEAFTRYVNDDPALACEPGKTSQYANIHYLALARIIEEVSGEPYETYVVDHILTPLKMESTSFQIVAPGERYAKPQYPADQIGKLLAVGKAYRGIGMEAMILGKSGAFSTLDDIRILAPWGGLFGTPSDVTHLLQMYLNDGRYGDFQVLKPETVAAMKTMQISTDGSPLGLGLSWWIDKDKFGTYYYHKGGGPGIEDTMRYYPDLDLGVVVMGSVAGYQPSKVAEGLVSAWMHEK